MDREYNDIDILVQTSNELESIGSDNLKNTRFFGYQISIEDKQNLSPYCGTLVSNRYIVSDTLEPSRSTIDVCFEKYSKF